MSPYVDYTIEEGIAHIVLDAPGDRVNILSGDFLKDLDRTADELSQNAVVSGAVILSAKEGGFIAGADIEAIEEVDDPDLGADLAREGQRILGRFGTLPFPVVAALHGHCMGGGTEFALACNYRIAAEDAAIALPEIKLGIFPGFGGTQRLPRLISLAKALDIILSGRTVRSREALRIGLVDRAVDGKDLRKAALALLQEVSADSRPILEQRRKIRGGWRNWLLEKNPLGRAILFALVRRTTARKTGGHYPAPFKALDVLRRGLSLPLEQGLELEAQGLGEMIVTPVCKNLIRVFRLSQRPKKESRPEGTPRKVRQAAVLGAGIMGGGIAHLLAEHDIPVRLKDLRPEAVEAGLGHARKLFGKRAQKTGGGEDEVRKKMALLTGTTDYGGFDRVDLVIEAVVERMEIKQGVLQEVEEVLRDDALFSTNTSALSVSELQGVGQRPQNVAGLHFFNPVDRMPLVEIIRGRQSAAETTATLFDLAVRLGKTPILVDDSPGFLVNRLLGAYLNEACLLAEEGVKWSSIDSAARRFGLPMGPFRLMDEVGIDIAAEVGKTLSKAFPYLPESLLLEKARLRGLKGRKGHRGFYLHPKKGKTRPNAKAAPLLDLRELRGASEQDWRRLMLLMVNEAGRCLEEGVIASPEDVDTGMIFGTGFPPFLGGLCRWADAEGVPALVTELDALSAPLGARFIPCGYLKGRDLLLAGKQ